mmetsp:Transcript_24908/g.40363  ORF Transcript_24908/g.40363 Transcript_24908/m.40363 type:complete len:84 (+) Transcript_24908:1259-1510(+)
MFSNWCTIEWSVDFEKLLRITTSRIRVFQLVYNKVLGFNVNQRMVQSFVQASIGGWGTALVFWMDTISGEMIIINHLSSVARD